MNRISSRQMASVPLSMLDLVSISADRVAHDELGKPLPDSAGRVNVHCPDDGLDLETLRVL